MKREGWWIGTRFKGEKGNLSLKLGNSPSWIAGAGPLILLYCHRARSARSVSSKDISGGTRLRCASATTPRRAKTVRCRKAACGRRERRYTWIARKRASYPHGETRWNARSNLMKKNDLFLSVFSLSE